MLDRHEAQDGQSGRELPHRDAAGESPLADRPMADREVPLPGTPGGSALALHQWLDGDLSEGEARRADARQVEFWSRMTTETDRRRRMTTPSHVTAQIMAALPDREVSLRADAPLATPARANGVATSTAMVIGAGFFTLGVAVGRMFTR
jgi:hypothetical protein